MASNGLIDDYAKVDETLVPQARATGYTAAQTAAPKAATVTPATATTQDVDQRSLVQNQIKGIIDENSPLQQQAATQARQAAAKAGLLNSSMAVTAGQDALYRAALPIAQQDASTYGKQSETNQAAKNQYGLANLQEQAQTSRFNAQEGRVAAEANTAAVNRAAEFGAGAANTAALNNLKAQQDVVLARLDATTRTQLAGIEANFKTLMQASQSASDLYNQVAKQIGDLQNNTALDGPSRAKLIEQQTALLQNGLQLLGAMNNLNLKDLLDFKPVTGLTPNAEPAPAPPPPPQGPSLQELAP